MPLELRTQRDGRLRRKWYGRYEANGHRYTVNLGVKILGTPPASLSLKQEGDGAFERSRAAAQAKLDSIAEEVRTKRDSVRLIEKLYEIKTGELIRAVKLADLAGEWAKMPRRHRPSPRYTLQCQATLRRFVEFVSRENPQADEVAHVTRGMAHLFMDAEAKRGITAKTFNDVLTLLRTAFRYLLPPGAVNPFSGIPTRDKGTVFRKPFAPEQLKAIMDVLKEDPFIRPIIVTGMCTAMRRGDCCLLRWKDVDLAGRFITVKTAKTGETVSIPVFPMLHEELLTRASKAGAANPEDYVFPSQAELYLKTPDAITRRVRGVLAAAGFRDRVPEEQNPEGRRGQPTGPGAVAPLFRGEIRVERKEGLRRASVRDFHSFRVTWVTLALTAGVPLELVQKVTGHKTADIVLKHYFQSGREAFRHALQTAMPKLLTNGQGSPPERMREIIEGMTAKTWKRDRRRLLGLLPGSI